MDLSAEYRAMCRNNNWLLNQWTPKDGDFILTSRPFAMVVGDDAPVRAIDRNRICVIHGDWRFDDAGNDPKLYASWLPRLDQLLAMIVKIDPLGLPKSAPPPSVKPALLRIAEKMDDAIFRGPTAEQIALSLWMLKVYGKAWNGRAWRDAVIEYIASSPKIPAGRAKRRGASGASPRPRKRTT